MAKLSATVSTTVTEEIKLAPKLRQRLLVELREYQTIAKQIKELKEVLGESLANIEAVREQLGLTKLGLEGFKIARVEGLSTYFDKKMCVDEGWLSPTQVERATKTKPKKAFTKVTVPGQKDHHEDGE